MNGMELPDPAVGICSNALEPLTQLASVAFTFIGTDREGIGNHPNYPHLSEQPMKQFFRIMPCYRCKLIVQEELAAIGLHYTLSDLDDAELPELDSATKYEILSKALHRFSLEGKLDKKSMLVAKLKAAIIEMIHYTDELPKTKYSVYLSDKLKHNYTYLSNLFSQVHGSTLEAFIIAQCIERAKALLAADEISLSEIAWKLRYSSVAHLSKQFKKVAGVSPSCFRSKESRIEVHA